MIARAHLTLAATARFYTPMMALFALALLIARPAGTGVGFIAGLAFLLLLWTHVLVFGAAAARRAAPPFACRLMAAAGLAMSATAALIDAQFAAQVGEAGLFLLTAAGGALVLTVLVGRAPTMRDEDA